MRTLPIPLLVCILASFPAAGDEISDLRDRIAQQQKQIEELRTSLAEQQRLLDALAQRQAAAMAPAAQSAPAPEVAVDGKPVAPLSFRIGGADFTPGGFMDFTSIFRSTNVGSGIGTSFGGAPLSNTPAGQLTESRFSAQNSRLALKVSAKPGKQTVTGYVEGDFLGALPTNAHVTSNSASLRLRLYWVQVVRGKWEVLGGQSWSMLTPNRVGLSPVPSDIYFSQNVDTNYQVGLTWTRAPQIRLIYHANKNWTAGFALENPEQYVGTAVTIPAAYSSQFDNTNATSVPNQHPDLISKVAYDSKVNDRAFHVEAAGLFRSFRSMRPNLTTTEAHGFGGSLNMSLEVVKNLRLLVTSFHSQGGGRYIFGLGPDLTVGPDGTISPVHATSGIAGFEYQSDPKTQWYTYYGGAYFRRNFTFVAPNQYLGFGFPGSANGANRQVQEATFGFTRTFWKSPNYGALQWMTQYSYLTRAPWFAAAGTPTTAHTHLVYLNLRFLLP